jgi:hypothetical protein
VKKLPLKIVQHFGDAIIYPKKWQVVGDTMFLELKTEEDLDFPSYRT